MHYLRPAVKEHSCWRSYYIHDLGVNEQKTSIFVKTVNAEVNNKTTLVEGLKVSRRRDEDGEWMSFQKHF